MDLQESLEAFCSQTKSGGNWETCQWLTTRLASALPWTSFWLKLLLSLIEFPAETPILKMMPIVWQEPIPIHGCTKSYTHPFFHVLDVRGVCSSIYPAMFVTWCLLGQTRQTSVGSPTVTHLELHARLSPTGCFAANLAWCIRPHCQQQIVGGLNCSEGNGCLLPVSVNEPNLNTGEASKHKSMAHERPWLTPSSLSPHMGSSSTSECQGKTYMTSIGCTF